MKNRILWFQNPDLESDDLLYLNEKEITPPSNTKYREAFSKLLNFDKSSKYKQKGQVFLYKLPDGWLLKGHYETRDVRGRKTPFMYYENEVNIDLFINNFRSDSTLANMEYSQNLLDTVKELSFSSKSVRKMTLYLILFLITIILAILILNNK